MPVRFQIALSCPPDAASPVAIAQIAEPDMCPVLGAPLRAALAEHLARVPVLVVHRDGDGDVRVFGDDFITRRLVGLDLDTQHWVTVELPGGGAPVASLRRAA